MSDIHHAETDKGGRYSLLIDGVEAYLTWERAGKDTRVITHTIVPDSLGGRGLGKRLVSRAMQDIVASDGRVGSTCWFATALIEKRPEWTARKV